MKSTIKRTYICKDVFAQKIDNNIPEGYMPTAGDVGIFEVLHIGKHAQVQGDAKRNVRIAPGDKIMAAFGTRYATEQFEGYLPKDVNQELHILGAGGTVGVLASMHYKFKNIGPTTLRFVGFVKDQFNRIINTKEIKKSQMTCFSGAAASVTRVVLSLGSSMDSGKTTTAAFLARGLKSAGYKVAYIKLTGTVYTKDSDLAYDLGADTVVDFSEFGFPSTYMCSESELLNLYESLLARVLPIQPDYVIMEIADGLYERETKMLLTSKTFKQTIDAVIFSAGDSLAAINGVNILNTWGLYPIMISGLLTASPLLIEEVRQNTDIPVYDIQQLSNGFIAGSIFINQQMEAIN